MERDNEEVRRGMDDKFAHLTNEHYDGVFERIRTLMQLHGYPRKGDRNRPQTSSTSSATMSQTSEISSQTSSEIVNQTDFMTMNQADSVTTSQTSETTSQTSDTSSQTSSEIVNQTNFVTMNQADFVTMNQNSETSSQTSSEIVNQTDFGTMNQADSETTSETSDTSSQTSSEIVNQTGFVTMNQADFGTMMQLHGYPRKGDRNRPQTSSTSSATMSQTSEISSQTSSEIVNQTEFMTMNQADSVTTSQTSETMSQTSDTSSHTSSEIVNQTNFVTMNQADFVTMNQNSETSSQNFSEPNTQIALMVMNETSETSNQISSEMNNQIDFTMDQYSSVSTSQTSLTISETSSGTMSQTCSETMSQATSVIIKQEQEDLSLPGPCRDPNWIPIFSNLDDMKHIMLKSLDASTIVLSTDGVIFFVSENITSLLGYLAREVMGRKLLSFLPDEEKNYVYEKIRVKIPLSKSVGNHIDFCCHIQRGNTKRGACPTYEPVKFILSLRDIFSKSFMFFGGFVPNCLRVESAIRRFPTEDRFFLVGSVCIVKLEIVKELCIAQQSHETSIKQESAEDQASEAYRNSYERTSRAVATAAADTTTAASFHDLAQPIKTEQCSLEGISRSESKISCSSSDTSISSSEVVSEALTTTFHAFAMHSKMDPRICQDPIDIEFPVDSSYLEEPQDLMKWEMPMVQEALMEPVVQEAMIEPLVREVLVKPVMPEVLMEPVVPEVLMEPMVQEDLLSCGMAASPSAQVLPTTSRHIVNSPDPWDVEDTPKKLYHGKVKRSPSDNRESKRFRTAFQMDMFIEGLENSFATSAQCLQELEQQMRQQDELQMQQEEEQEEKTDMEQWELHMQQEMQNVVPEGQQGQEQQLQLQQVQSDVLTPPPVEPEQQACSSNGDDSESWGDGSSSICLSEQQGAASSHSSDSLSTTSLSQSPVSPLSDFNTEDIVQLWLESPSSQGVCPELDNWTASDQSSSQEQADWQQQVEEEPEPEDPAPTANHLGERPLFPLRNYSLSNLLLHWDSLPHP